MDAEAIMTGPVSELHPDPQGEARQPCPPGRFSGCSCQVRDFRRLCTIGSREHARSKCRL